MPDLLLVASRKGLLRFHRQGEDWVALPPCFLGEPVSAVLADPRDGGLITALRLGHFGVKLHRSDDGGATWRALPAPAFPVQADPAAPAVDVVWTLEAGGADEPGRLWAGTLPAALFTSTDGGQSWSLVESLWAVPERARWFGGGYDLPGLHSILVDPRDSRRLTVGISSGGIWRSTDAGASWRQAGHGLRAEYMPPDQAFDPVHQDPHRLAQCRAAPEVVWCQHHNGIFRSIDGGDTFEEIRDVRPSAFGFAVAAHPAAPGTAWFVPAIKDECRVPAELHLVVNRTDDGGASFTALADGLPARSYDLVYRHALAVDASGETLAMGSTTGNLWLSQDGGEHWRCLATTLPPIAQVAFTA